jgi:hypothetical protein
LLMARCAGKKGDGTPCERIVGASREYCYAHDPAFAEDRKRAASKAGRGPTTGRSGRELRQIKGRLEDLYGAVLEGSVTRQDAAVANQIANTQLRAIELERRVREQEELEEHLDELEAMLEDAERRTSVSRR